MKLHAFLKDFVKILEKLINLSEEINLTFKLYLDQNTEKNSYKCHQ